jgi:SAM-dependent methyltransferase
MANPFSDAAMAAGYAAARPPVHPHVVARLREWLGPCRVSLAVDLGCGAGLSTRPLIDLAVTCVGLDPAEMMVRAARTVVPAARFATAAGEALPLGTRTVDLITAAGSLNYARDPDRVWHEAARVLAPGGAVAVYDFTPGRSFIGDDRLDRWFEAFMQRYPAPVAQARPLSPSILAEAAPGFRVARSTGFEIAVPLTRAFYLEYMLTETNVQDAVRRGTPLADIRGWCDDSLRAVFTGDAAHDVVFRGYLALLTPTHDA